MKDSIKIGPRFFAVEKQNYSSWRRALVREAVQNMVDSPGCTRIEINTEKVNKGNSTKLTFIDNGGGLSKETLLNVFLVMGNTGKDDGNSLGGYGRARVILCWAQENYSITSHKYYLTGCGAEYDIKETKDFYRGCKFEITTDNSDWESIIKFVLDKSSLNQSVYINGEKYVNTLRRGRMVRELSFANIYVNKSANPQLLVRVGGCWMFSKHIDNVKAQICVELKPETSRDSMVSNRDGLQYEKDNELQSFLNELACNGKSALKDKTRHFKKIVNEGKCFTSRPRAQFKVTESGGLIKNDNPNINVISNQVIENGYRVGAINPSDNETLGSFADFCPILNSMMINNECESPETVRLINNFYHPTCFKKTTSTRYQLLKEWFAISQIVADEFSQHFNKEINFSVGWVFSEGEDRCEAKCISENNINYILLNPIDITNKLKYSVNDSKDWLALITLCVHEFSHALPSGESYHNERFASIMTSLMIKVLGRMKEIFHAVKAIK